MVSGHSTRASSASSSHPVSLTALRSSHKVMVNRSQLHTVMTPRLGGERGRGQVPDDDPGLLAGRDPARGPGHDRAGRAGRSGRAPARTARAGQQPGHDRGGAAERLGGQLDFDGPHLPRRTGWCRCWASGSRRRARARRAGPRRAGGAQAPLGMPPRPALRPGRGGLAATAGRPARRGCAPAGPATGGVGRVAEPGGGHPGRGQPAPGRAGPQPPGGGVPGPAPPRRDRRAAGRAARRARRRAGRTARRSARRTGSGRRCPAVPAGPRPRRSGARPAAGTVSWSGPGMGSPA